jgi:putative ABC transport system ATP-binding protein
MNIIEIKNLTKTYKNGPLETHVLKGLDLTVREGEFVAIMGKSGAGKSTFMYQMSLLDEPTTGEIVVDGVPVLTLSNKDRTKFRLEKLGYVFQDYALVPELTALENVLIPLMMRGFDDEYARRKAATALTNVGLETKLKNRPSQLSGGEQQRVSIARAIAEDPKILFADEPTANLDSASGKHIVEVLRDINAKGQTIVMVTHEKEYTLYCDRIVHLEDGKIVREEKLK